MLTNVICMACYNYLSGLNSTTVEKNYYKNDCLE